MTSTNIETDLQQYKRALAIAAQIVARDGDKFLPVYIRLEDEVKKTQNALDARNRALKAACIGEGTQD